MVPIKNDIYFSGKDYGGDEDIEFGIPRQLLRMFVYSIGRIAYDIDMKGQLCVIAQDMLSKIDEQLKGQLSDNDRWFQYNF